MPHGGTSRFRDEQPDYVIVGVVTRDVIPGGFVPGGTVTYAGLTAQALGRRVGVVTSASPELDLLEILPGIAYKSIDSPFTTTFENVYTNGQRQQWLRAVATPIQTEDVPTGWFGAPIVHLAPLAAEFGPDLVRAARSAQLLGVTPQGWLRAWDAGGFVRRVPWDHAHEILQIVDVVVLSQEDLDGGMAACAELATSARLLVATQGALGCTVFEGGGAWQVAGFPTSEVDATGAGDVFAGAYFVRLLETGDPLAAARYANCVASFSVEAVGVTGIPTSEAIERRLTTVPLERRVGS